MFPKKMVCTTVPVKGSNSIRSPWSKVYPPMVAWVVVERTKWPFGSSSKASISSAGGGLKAVVSSKTTVVPGGESS